MQLEIDQESLATVWTELNKPWRPGHAGPRTCHRCVVESGWAGSVDLQDILWEMDDRADVACRRDALKFLLAPHNLHFISRYRGPFMRAKEVYGHKALRAADAAEFIMQVERLGFSVTADSLVAALRPGLLRQRYATNSELSILWYKRQRHRSVPLVAYIPNSRATEASTLRTHSGYRATALLDGSQPVALRVDAPRCRGSLRLDWWIEMALQHPQRLPAC